MLYDNKRWDKPLVESEPVEILKRSRLRIIQGWCALGPSDDKGGVCILLSVTRQYTQFASWGTNSLPAFDEALGYIRQATGAICLPDWNDDPKRTKDEVVAGLDRAIELARGNLK